MRRCRTVAAQRKQSYSQRTEGKLQASTSDGEQKVSLVQLQVWEEQGGWKRLYITLVCPESPTEVTRSQGLFSQFSPHKDTCPGIQEVNKVEKFTKFKTSVPAENTATS